MVSDSQHKGCNMPSVTSQSKQMPTSHMYNFSISNVKQCTSVNIYKYLIVNKYFFLALTQSFNNKRSDSPERCQEVIRT